MNRLTLRFHLVPVFVYTISLSLTTTGQEGAVSLADGFREPPESGLLGPVTMLKSSD